MTLAPWRPSVDDWDWRTLRSIALQESHALRAYARAGKTPKARKLVWPWEPNYLGDYKPEKLHDLEHGTVACYRQHNRLGTPPCQPCLDAMSLWARQQRLNSKQPA
jgi:hypothetical protein